MYFPKTLQRFSPKHEKPLTLKSICLDATLELLINTNSDKERNARTKKQIRKYLDTTLPQTVQKEILTRATRRWVGAEKMIRLLDIFEPIKTVKNDINLLGNFRYAYGCYFVRNRLFWSNGTIERLNMSLEDCERLYNILLWSSPDALKTIAMATQRHVLGSSRLPSVIARSHILTSITILNGATNHVLRILGLNCPLLQLIDVSHSSGVTDWGMRGLLLRFPRNKNKDYETNECTKSLVRCVLLGTEVTRGGFEFVCRILGIGYSISFLPDTIIIRPQQDNIKLQAFEMDSRSNSIWQLGMSDTVSRGLEQIVRRYTDKVTETEGITDVSQVLDIYEKEDLVDVFVRDPASFIIQSYVRIDGKCITKLILAWDSFVWRLTSLPELTDLGTELPNLKVLKARLQGTWDKSDPLLPNLEEAHIWSINDCTIMSFLKHSPKIKRFIFNCLNFNNTGGMTPWNLAVDDVSIQKALTANFSLLNNIEEFCIRPAPRLSHITVRFLIAKCPHLSRLGDMESWNITTNQIKDFNKTLDQTNSRCVLTVLSFPPKEMPDNLL